MEQLFNWQTTDNIQFVKLHRDGNYQFVEFRILIGEEFGIDSAIIDFNEYTESEILRYIKPYGYESIESVMEEYGLYYYRRIISEYIFDSLGGTSILRTLNLEECLSSLRELYGIQHNISYHNTNTTVCIAGS